MRPHRRGDLARVVLYRRRCLVLLLRAAALAGAARRYLHDAGHGAAHRHRRTDRPRRAAGGVHAAAHPQAGVRHPAAGADVADASIALHVLAGRADHRHRDQRDLARPGQRGPMAVRHLRRGRRDRLARHVRLLPGICGRTAAAPAETAEAQGEEATPRPTQGRRGRGRTEARRGATADEAPTTRNPRPTKRPPSPTRSPPRSPRKRSRRPPKRRASTAQEAPAARTSRPQRKPANRNRQTATAQSQAVRQGLPVAAAQALARRRGRRGLTFVHTCYLAASMVMRSAVISGRQHMGKYPHSRMRSAVADRARRGPGSGRADVPGDVRRRARRSDRGRSSGRAGRGPDRHRRSSTRMRSASVPASCSIPAARY